MDELSTTLTFESYDWQEFKLHTDELDLKTSYINEIISNGEELESKIILKNGVDFHLDEMDKNKVDQKLVRIIGDCSYPDQLITEKKFDFREHVSDKTKSELKERGFSTSRTTLYDQVASIIFQAGDIQKAKVHFFKDGHSKPNISYTLSARLGTKTGRIAISFSDEMIMIVTVLSFK